MVHLFHLFNRSKFDVTGNMNIRTTFTGQELNLTATQSNRTVKLSTCYDVRDQNFKQRSRLELSPTAWISYELNLNNKTIVITLKNMHAFC